jgi:hypothetical protein
MSLNKEYASMMDAGVKNLLANQKFEKGTGHVTYAADKLELPEGITGDSMQLHVGYINDLSAMTEEATAQYARTAHEENEKLTSLDSTLTFGGFAINSQHHLQQRVGDEYLYGLSTTAVDYVHNENQTGWLEQQRQSNVDLATKLFG